MSFQSIVNAQQGFGVYGEIRDSTPARINMWVLNSANAANNIFGRAFTRNPGITAYQEARAGNPNPADPTVTFAGILVGPKDYALNGNGVAALNPSLTLQNGTEAQLMTEGTVVVLLANNGKPGDWVIYNNTTGALSALTQGDPLPSGSSYAFAQVVEFVTSSSSPQIATIWVNASAIPVPVSA